MFGHISNIKGQRGEETHRYPARQSAEHGQNRVAVVPVGQKTLETISLRCVRYPGTSAMLTIGVDPGALAV